MEDLSSLEGPPMQDGRFTPISFPMSPVSPENTYIAYNPLRDVPVSPLTSATRSVYARSSISSIPGANQVTPLRNSRSHSALRDVTDVPPRPASTDNANCTSTPFWLLVNGSLVWVEELQLWVLWDDVVTSHNLGTYYSQQQTRQQQQQQQHQEQEQEQEQQQQQQQRQSGRGIRTWKSLPPLPHEVHHLLPIPMDVGPSFDPNDRIQRRDPFGAQNNLTNARIRLQWASLAGQLAPHISSADRIPTDPLPQHSHTELYPQSLRPAQPSPPQTQPSQQGNSYHYYT
ncbi:hypothetical protein EYB26_000892 [Talaromyces marneffei]|uniref:65-kDa microtubule-associated protein 6 n=1 Tax=Talaromyces marneffei PM1 TaxID=1077442 RepID=A0A093XZV1_TALMA|nr:uncharacterized protein EYB26_000892 [Talaromyces marneffei]QGA13245.1 hypothetical protein EYB26_000892 [Talaromyces marneffei]